VDFIIIIFLLLLRMEIFFGQRADFNLCVTNAMKDDLGSYNIKFVDFFDNNIASDSIFI
jgi:hypothetical protein